MKNIILLVSLIFLFVGCANKININDYRPTSASTNELAPKDLLKHKQKNGVIIAFPNYSYQSMNISSSATSFLHTNLQNLHTFSSLKILPKHKLKEYIKLSELELEGGDISNNYIIQGNIEDVNYKTTYHPTAYIRTKKKITKIPWYWEYQACASININVLASPSLQNKYSDFFRACSYSNGYGYQHRYFNKSVILNALTKTINEASNQIKINFASKGYILRIKKHNNDFIAKISLGKNQGIKAGSLFVIYDLSKDPDTQEIITHKIGTAEVGENTIYNNFCWVTVDLDDNKELKIGDLVKQSFETSFFGF